LREEAAVLQHRRMHGHRRVRDVLHFHQRMRIAHGGSAKAQGGFALTPVVLQALLGGSQRDVRGQEIGPAHVERVAVAGQALDLDRAGRAVEREARRFRSTFAHQPGGDAARAVAALLRGAAVAVPDPVAGRTVPPGGVGDRQQLVEAHAPMAIGDGAHHRGVGRGTAPAQVEHHEVVAGPVHLGEVERHACVQPEAASAFGSGRTNSPLLPQAASRVASAMAIRSSERRAFFMPEV